MMGTHPTSLALALAVALALALCAHGLERHAPLHWRARPFCGPRAAGVRMMSSNDGQRKTDWRGQPPISEEQQRRSPGLRNNFYESDISDFKRPYGTGRGGPSTPPPWPGGGGAPGGDFGAEQPMPGREQEFMQYQQ